MKESDAALAYEQHSIPALVIWPNQELTAAYGIVCAT
jgi:hypothetical protein